ncbi:MAG TPA: hypothetical protein VGU67_02720 [Edaphobacter sp.]|nr:hypothetical protein [Edaphobacter sp.]
MIQIITIPSKKIRKPCTKKRRIQNKWAANPRSFQPSEYAYRVDTTKPFMRPEPIEADYPF